MPLFKKKRIHNPSPKVSDSSRSGGWFPADVAQLEWLDARTTPERLTGWDADGWPDSVWILHTMFELPHGDSESYDQRRKRLIATGELSPTVIGDINLDEVGTVTGASLGMTEPMPPPWHRLRWRDLAARLSVELGGNDYRPCFRWFPYNSWPVNIVPPSEGSLDRSSLDALTDCLAEHSTDGSDTRCLAYMTPLACGFDPPDGLMARPPLGALPLFGNGEQRFTPSNFWPVDHEWFVYTDWDLWGTKVSGTTALIADIESHDFLETIRWPSTTLGRD